MCYIQDSRFWGYNGEKTKSLSSWDSRVIRRLDFFLFSALLQFNLGVVLVEGAIFNTAEGWCREGAWMSVRAMIFSNPAVARKTS